MIDNLTFKKGDTVFFQRHYQHFQGQINETVSVKAIITDVVWRERLTYIFSILYRKNGRTTIGRPRGICFEVYGCEMVLTEKTICI
jgi:hypothetical protein